MEMPVAIAILLRPLVSAVLLAVVVAPIVWVLHKVTPNSTLKVILFKVRSGDTATRRDKVIMTVAAIFGYAVIALIAWAVA